MLGIIFDVEGTLFDSNELHVDCWDRAFRRFGKQFPQKSAGIRSMQKKAPRIPSGALLCRAEAALLNFNKLRIACADHSLRVNKAVHVNRNPTAVHEREVRIPDQSEMVRPESLDEELFRMPRASARARTRARLIRVHVLLCAALNVRLTTYISARLRFCLRFARLRLFGTHFLPFRRRRRLGFLGLPLRGCLLWLRLA